MLLSSGQKEFRGTYKDRVTKQNIVLRIIQLTDNKIKLSYTYPEMDLDIDHDFKKGTIFPKEAEFIKKKL